MMTLLAYLAIDITPEFQVFGSLLKHCMDCGECLPNILTLPSEEATQLRISIGGHVAL